jgi:ribonuclease-3
LINEYSLARIATGLNIGKFLFLGKGEEITGGRKKPSLLSNAYEAVLAAIYLDGGFRAASKVIRRHFSKSFSKTSLKKLDRDYKSQLQEKSHKMFKETPKYRIVKKSGPEHRQVFKVELVIDKKTISKGKGNSKKEAEQNAAKKALGILKKCDTK